VDKGLHKQGTVTGVSGRLTAMQGGKRPRFRVVAPVVVLAAGALESPMLWFRSGLPDSYGIAGRTLHLHPYAVLTGVFGAPLAAWQGPPQSCVVDEFLNLDKSTDGGFLWTAASAQPIAAAALFPGIGRDHQRLMDSYARTAGIGFFVHDRSL